MRVVVTGATGNVGTSVLDSLGADDAVSSILGIARRLPAARFAKAEFVVADVARDDLAPLLEGADAVVHLAWLIQPSHDEATLRRTNVDGSSRTFAAVVAAGVPALVVASSVGAYSARVDAHPVDESWPTEGIPASWYSRQKAEVERRLDALEVEHRRCGSFGCARRSRRSARPRAASAASSQAPSFPPRSSGRSGSRSCRTCRA